MITKVEEKDGKVWFKLENEGMEFWVVVDGCLNIHSQGIAESVDFSIDLWQE